MIDLARARFRQHRRVSVELIEIVRQASPIVAIAGELVPLRRAGARFVGRCPWHASRGGRSFVVSPEHGTFRCWAGCAHGDAFAFIQRIHGVGFHDAVLLLARRAGIESGVPIPAAVSERMSIERDLREVTQKIEEALHGELLGVANALDHTRHLHDRAVRRLTELELGATPRWPGEDGICADVIAFTTDEIRMLDVAYAILAFGRQADRERLASSPENRDQMIAAAMARGFVIDDRGRRFEVPL